LEHLQKPDAKPTLHLHVSLFELWIMLSQGYVIFVALDVCKSY
jgi:hypothetical protein